MRARAVGAWLVMAPASGRLVSAASRTAARVARTRVVAPRLVASAARALVVATVVSSLIVAAAVPASAQALDPSSAEALAAVMRLFANPAQRDAAIAASPRAQAADGQIRALAGSDPQAMQEFYALAAQVFSELTQASGGDVAKMSDALTRAQADPAGFAAMLRPETLARLRALATRLSDQRR